MSQNRVANSLGIIGLLDRFLPFFQATKPTCDYPLSGEVNEVLGFLYMLLSSINESRGTDEGPI